MVCTSAFGCGNDHPHVCLVIHAGSPKEMIDYIQEKSYAGRDGQPALSIILLQNNFA
jgi:superfamily II DNA helicase RecQ